MVLMAVSVSSQIVATIDGKCTSLQGEPAEGVLVTVVTCDPNDHRQTNWVTNVVGKNGLFLPIYQFCFRGTNLCQGYKKDGETYMDYQELVIADPKSLAQQWVRMPGLTSSLKNLGKNLCDEAVDGLLIGRECKDIPAQHYAYYEE